MTTRKSLFIYVIVLIGISVGCAKDIQDITMIGSTTMGPVMKQLAKSYDKMNRSRIKVVTTGSLTGLSLLVDGKNDIADSSVKIPAELLWESQKKGMAIREILVGYDIIIPIVHRTNAVGNLFLGQLADIYAGLIRDWKEVGGSSGNIVVVDRIDASGTKLVMSEQFFESTKVVEGSIKINCDSNVVAFVAQHPNAVGYISKSFINSSIKSVDINGFGATIDNVEKKYYPLYRELYVYVDEKSFKGQIKSFIELLLSTKGQKILQQYGFIPVNRLMINKKFKP
jgi:phosphate transport system substrate-binding protein